MYRGDKVIKLIGSVAVIGAGTWLGVAKRNALKARVNSLQEIQNALLHMQSSIDVSAEPLCNLLCKSPCPLFCRAAEYIDSRGVSEGFAKAVCEQELYEDEKNALLDFAGGLAAQDKEGQLLNIRACADRIARIKAEAEDKRVRLSGLYTASGFLGGAALVLIFL